MRPSSHETSWRSRAPLSLAEPLEPRGLLAASLFADVFGDRLLFTADHPSYGRGIWQVT